MAKKTIAQKEPVKLREKKLSNGNISLYLDIYRNGKRHKEYLKLYLIEAKTPIEREQNRQTLATAQAIKSKRLIEIQNGEYTFTHQFKEDTPFLEYYRNMVKERNTPDTRGNYGNWQSCLRYLELYCDEKTTFRDVTPEFILGFKDFLESVEKDTHKRRGPRRERDVFQGLSQNSKASYFRKLSACINHAYDERIIAVNPLRGIEGFKDAEVKRDYLTKEKANPQSPEEMAKAAQEAAVKAAMEQAQSMFGNIPGFQMPGGMEEQLMAQMGAGMPDMAAAQAQQEAMLKAAGIDPETVAQAGRQNMAYAQQMMQGMMDGTLGEELSSSDAMAQMMDAFGSDGWTINKADDGKLDTAQLRLLAFGAPMLVYNDENVDSIDCPEEDVESIRSTIESWWNVTDRESTLEIVKWLLEEGHHAEADEALEKVRKRGIENISQEERDDEESKIGDVCLIAESMEENGWCPGGKMPGSVIAWDLVRLVNLGRWAYLCGYVSESEMWQIMQAAADTALEHFSSWEEYGMSFVMGRGVWHGDPDDSETAYEIVSLLLEDDESPWKKSNFNIG